jgi:predicted glutamine amidotransferase
MCELFAMCSREPTDARASLAAFARHGGLDAPHGDGWGLAYYAEGDVRLVKDPEPASRSECLRFLNERAFASSMVLSHIRRATQGRLAMRNCQPFARELGGRMHVFAHNGDLDLARLAQRLPLGRFRPVGETDSEYAFCALLERVPVGAPLEERLAAVADFAAALRALGPANFLYADGEVLFAHGDRRSPGEGRAPVPPGLHVLERSCAPAQRVVLAASVPLSDEPGWRPLAKGDLLALRAGRIVAGCTAGSSSRSTAAPRRFAG